MNLVRNKLMGSGFLWGLVASSVLFFWANWFFVFFLFAADFAKGFFPFLAVLVGGSVLLLLVVFFEGKSPFAWLIFVFGNLLPWGIFCLFNGAGFLALLIFSLLSTLFFFSGRKHFKKESANQIVLELLLVLKSPYKGLVFSLAILLACSFYFVKFSQEKKVAEEEEIFGPAIEGMVLFWKNALPTENFSEKLSLEMTIDEYIKKNLPPQDKSLLGKTVQLEDGSVVIFNQAMLDDLERKTIANTREQIAGQYKQPLRGDEKLFQVIGMIIDQRAELVLDSFRAVWPNLNPILFAKALSVFFVFIWVAGLLRWLVLKLVQGLLAIFIHKGWAIKSSRMVEKEEWFLR